MTRADGAAADRGRGSVRVCGGSLQVRGFAGVDPVPGRGRYLSESVKGTDRAARRQADKVMARLQAELEDSIRDTYVGYIERTIRPTLGGTSLSKLSTRMLQSWLLTRCRRPFSDDCSTGSTPGRPRH